MFVEKKNGKKWEDKLSGATTLWFKLAVEPQVRLMRNRPFGLDFKPTRLAYFIEPGHTQVDAM
jgi:hypothetical protein